MGKTGIYTAMQVGGNDLSTVRSMSAFIMGVCRRYTARLGL